MNRHKGQQMETNKQTELLFSTESTEKRYDKLEDFVSVSKPGDLLEAVEYSSFVDFPLSADDILDEADWALYCNDNYICSSNYLPLISPKKTKLT